MTRLPLAACLAAIACLASGMGARAATAEIGDLTLTYDAARWIVTPGKEGTDITCQQADCQGVSVRMTVSRNDTRLCDRRSAYEAAREAFPFTDRHAVNGFAVNNLYLVLAESREGPLLDTPGAASGCISRGGTYYAFRSTGAPIPGSAGHVFTLVHGLSGPPGTLHTRRVGDLSFDYADDLWQVEPESTDTRTTLRCLPPACSEGDVTVDIAALADLSACADTLFPADHGNLGSDETIRSRGGISFRFQGAWTGCRNLTPPILLACAVHRDMAYRVATTESGCRSSSGVPVDAFTGLIESMRPNAP